MPFLQGRGGGLIRRVPFSPEISTGIHLCAPRRPSVTLSRVLSSHTIAINLAVKCWARVAICTAPRILPRHRTRNTPSLDANDSVSPSLSPFCTSFLHRKRARRKRERIDEIRNADHGHTIGINLSPSHENKSRVRRRFYLHACPRVISGFLLL